MKKNTLLIVGLVLTAGLMLSTQQVSAADTISTKSKSGVTVKKNDGSGGEEPLNPEKPDPEKPVKPNPEKPEPPSTKGPLSINYISYIEFGSQTASGNDASFFAENDSVLDNTDQLIEVPNYIQITDHRGSNAGWTLMVKQDGAFKVGANELTGTELIFNNPVYSSVSGTAQTAPTLTSNFTLGANTDATVVMKAAEGQGMGTWINRFGVDTTQGKQSIQLKVPGNSKKVEGRYETSLVWTLSDTPTP